MILDLVKQVCEGVKNVLSMLWVHLDDFPDEDDCFKTCHTSFLLEDQEGAHKWPNELRDRRWVLLSNSVDAFNKQVSILISSGASLNRSTFLSRCLSLSGPFILCHLLSLEDLTLQENSNLFDISLSRQISDQLEHLLVDIN